MTARDIISTSSFNVVVLLLPRTRKGRDDSDEQFLSNRERFARSVPIQLQITEQSPPLKLTLETFDTGTPPSQFTVGWYFDSTPPQKFLILSSTAVFYNCYKP